MALDRDGVFEGLITNGTGDFLGGQTLQFLDTFPAKPSRVRG